ncbi:MAG: VWA domain-containing protein [Bacteroidetes bacterium]|nr:VWA domain-containing protein [Bacteroidota bacterium]
MKSKTYYQLILDASGSMSNVRSETLNAVNNQILSIRSLAERMPGQEMVVSLVLFNTEVTTLYSHLGPEQAPLLTSRQYVPEGSTALLDAIGMRIMDTERLLSPEDDVVIVVLTDGEENASQFFTYKQIAEKISNRKRTERWSFSFVGADIDA